jgi:alpha-beta hydrolase superfamily lysophospholipase
MISAAARARSAAVAGLVALLCIPSGARSPSAVAFRTQDGVLIAGAFYDAGPRPAPAVLLVHMLTRTRDDWRRLAERLSEEGVHALAIDLRGHGGSGAGEIGGPDAPLSGMVADLRAARRYLADRPDVRQDRVAVVGAQIGANLAVILGAEDATIRAIVLLSPGLDYRGLRTEAALKKYGARPALLVASSEDPYAVRSIRQLLVASPGRERRLLENAGHGTVMLDRSPALIGDLVDWLERALL